MDEALEYYSTTSVDIDQERIEVLHFKWNSVTWHVAGPIRVYVILVTVTINLVFLILLRNSGMPFVVSFLLSAIATMDMLTAMSMFPVAMYIYQKPYDIYVPYTWCHVINVFYPMAELSHAVSIWLTLLLGVFRYISVCHPTKAATCCRKIIVVRATLLMFALLIPMFVVDLFKLRVVPREIWRPDSNRPEIGCNLLYRQWTLQYNSVMEIFRIVLVQLVPCISLVVITSRLMFTIWKADRKRCNLTHQNTEEISSESRRTTVLLGVVMFMFLLGEISFTLVFIGSLVARHNGLNTVFNSMIMVDLLNDLVLATGCFNFCVYCLMGRKIRSALRRCYCPSKTHSSRAV